MRILSLGVPMPGPRVDNHTFFNAPSFSDYAAAVADPAAASRVIEDVVAGTAEHRTYFDQPVVNGPSTPASVGLADLLLDRRRQTEKLLANGGVVVLMAHPDVTHTDIDGLPECSRYCWLPSPEGIAWRPPHLLRAEGVQIGDVERDHPLAAYVEAAVKNVGYCAEFDERAPGMQGTATVFARSAGGGAVGVEFRVAGGTVIFAPALVKTPSAEDRYRISDALQAGVARLTARVDESAPSWLKEYPLPGLPGLDAALSAARDRVEEARAEAREAEARRADVERYRRILWLGPGPALLDAARAALEVIGFTVAGGVEESLSAMVEGRRALIEVESADGEAGLEPHYRLRRRMDDVLAAGKPLLRGIVIVNGHRSRSPAERHVQYSDALRASAEAMRYCLATTEQLFQAVRAALDGDETTAGRFRDLLLNTDGVLSVD